MPVRPGAMLSRSESHWCDGCLRGRAPGDGLTANFRCEECDGPEPQWTEHEIDRTDAAGIASRRKLAQDAGHKRAAKLAGAGGVGKFIVVQALVDNPTPNLHLRPHLHPHLNLHLLICNPDP